MLWRPVVGVEYTVQGTVCVYDLTKESLNSELVKDKSSYFSILRKITEHQHSPAFKFKCVQVFITIPVNLCLYMFKRLGPNVVFTSSSAYGQLLSWHGLSTAGERFCLFPEPPSSDSWEYCTMILADGQKALIMKDAIYFIRAPQMSKRLQMCFSSLKLVVILSNGFMWRQRRDNPPLVFSALSKQRAEEAVQLFLFLSYY